jgi:hypothetical protein
MGVFHESKTRPLANASRFLSGRRFFPLALMSKLVDVVNFDQNVFAIGLERKTAPA